MIGRFIAVLTLSLAAILPVQAQTFNNWLGAAPGDTANMNNPANWSAGVVPTGVQLAFLNQVGDHAPVLNSDVTNNGLAIGLLATTPYTVTGPGVWTVNVAAGGAGGYINSASNANLTVDIGGLIMANSSAIIAGDYYSGNSADAGAGNLTIGSPGTAMTIKWRAGTGTNRPYLFAADSGANNGGGGKVLTIYPKLDFSLTTGTTSNRLEFRPGAQSVINVFGGIGNGSATGSPSRLIQALGSAGGKTVLGDSAGWTGILQVNISDVEINSSNSLGVAGVGTNYTETISGTATGALRLTNNVNISEHIYIYGRTTTARPQIRSISGANVLNGNLDSDGNLTGFAMVNSDGIAPGDSLTINGNAARTGTGNGVLILQGAGVGTFNGFIGQTNSGVWTEVRKDGPGTWTLTSNMHGYPGTTNIVQGTLALTGTATLATTPSIAISSGANFDVSALSGGYTMAPSQSLFGTGTVTGGITADSSNTISPGTFVTPNSTPGTLTITGPITVNGTILPFQLSSNSATGNDKFISSGALTPAGPTTITVTMLNGVLGSGTYHLIDYSGPAVDVTPSGFTVAGITLSPRQTSATLVSTANHLDLEVVGGPATLTWLGGNNGNAWDVATTINWTGAPAPANDNRFYDGDSVIFSSTGTNTVNVVGTVVPGALTFNNGSSQAYTITGDTINTGGALIVSGAGDVTVSNSVLNANSFTHNGSGTVLFNGGEVTLTGAVTQSGSGQTVFANTGAINLPASVAVTAGKFVLRRPDTLAIPTAFTGAGTLRKEEANMATLSGSLSGFSGAIEAAGNGILVINGANAGYSGVMTVQSGTLRTVGNTAMGQGGTVANGITVVSGATLDLGTNGNTTVFNGTEVVTAAGLGIGGLGAITAGQGIPGVATTAHINRLILPAASNVRIAAIGSGTTSSGRSLFYIDGTNAGIEGNGSNLDVVVDVGSAGGGTFNNGTEMNWLGVGDPNLNIITLSGGGALFIGGNTTLGGGGGITFNTGGRLGIYSADNNVNTGAISKPMFVNPGVVAEIEGYQGNKTVDSPITLLNDGGMTPIHGDIEFNMYVSSTNPNPVLTLAGVLTGGGTVFIHTVNSTTTRAGTVEFTNSANALTGPITISGGGGILSIISSDRVTLSIGNGGTTGAIGGNGAITVNEFGTLLFNRNAAYTIANPIIGAGKVTSIAPDGVVTLSNANAYTGPTTIMAGTLSITGDASAATGAVTVSGGNSSGGKLQGTGIVGGPVTVTSGTVPGTIRGGTSIGTLTLINGLTTGAGGRILVEIGNGSFPAAVSTGGSTDLVNLPNPTRNSYLSITGGATLIDPGTIIAVEVTGGSFAPSTTYSYQIARTADPQNFTLNDPNQFSFTGLSVDPASVSLTALTDINNNGNIFLNFTTSPVPEPALVVGLAALAMIGLRRRK